MSWRSTSSEDRNEQRIIMAVPIIAAALIFIAIICVWFAAKQRNSGTSSTDTDTTKGNTVDSYDACSKAGNPILQTYPEVCITKDGKRFANPAQSAPNPPAR